MTSPNNHHGGPLPLQQKWDLPAAPATEATGATSDPVPSRWEASADPWPVPNDHRDRRASTAAPSVPWAVPTAVNGSARTSPPPTPPPPPAPTPPALILAPGAAEPVAPAAPPWSPAPQVEEFEAPGPPTGTGTSDDLSYDQLVMHRRDRPTTGWRGAVYTVTGGHLNPGLSAVEAERRQQMTRVGTRLGRRCHMITVASAKGGVGKTTVSALLGLTLAEYRGDRVVALDANPDAGTLADRLLGHSVPVTVRDLLNNLHTIHSLPDITRFTSLAGRLQVLASEQDPKMSESFNKTEYEAVTRALRRFHDIIITDSGTGLMHSAMHGALEATNTLVIVGAPTVDAASRAAKTLDYLKAHGYVELVSNAVVALSLDRFSRYIDRGAVRDHFANRCRAVVEIPEDPHLATGGRIELDQLRTATRDAALSLSAHVADQFAWQRPPGPATPHQPAGVRGVES